MTKSRNETRNTYSYNTNLNSEKEKELNDKSRKSSGKITIEALDKKKINQPIGEFFETIKVSKSKLI